MSRSILDLDEARRAINDLTSSDLLRIMKVARIYAFGTAYEVDDLVNEAVCSVLTGARNCPRDIPMVLFLVSTIRSKASHIRDALKREPELVGLDATGTDGRTIHEVIAASDKNAEEAYLSNEDFKHRIGALEDLFFDDEEAMLFVWAKLEEMPKEEIKAMNSLDDKSYDTIRRRVRRKIERRFPTGWTS